MIMIHINARNRNSISITLIGNETAFVDGRFAPPTLVIKNPGVPGM